MDPEEADASQHASQPLRDKSKKPRTLQQVTGQQREVLSTLSKALTVKREVSVRNPGSTIPDRRLKLNIADLLVSLICLATKPNVPRTIALRPLAFDADAQDQINFLRSCCRKHATWTQPKESDLYYFLCEPGQILHDTSINFPRYAHLR